ncbi:MAG: hypothetical protein P8M62_04015 [Opitutae bacterium]|nr:hypothetical protein [Opitutae bacterium]MDG2345206.1 hypothetical protein [Opitutae bacterium]
MKLNTLLIPVVTACLIPLLVQAKGQSINGEGEQRQRPTAEERGERFANADTDGDEQLSLEEIEIAGATRLAKHFDRIDADGDGLLTKDELKKAHKMRRKGDRAHKRTGPDSDQ